MDDGEFATGCVVQYIGWRRMSEWAEGGGLDAEPVCYVVAIIHARKVKLMLDWGKEAWMTTACVAVDVAVVAVQRRGGCHSDASGRWAQAHFCLAAWEPGSLTTPSTELRDHYDASVGPSLATTIRYTSTPRDGVSTAGHSGSNALDRLKMRRWSSWLGLLLLQLVALACAVEVKIVRPTPPGSINPY